MLKGFQAFILRGNVVDLAVGVIIGAAFNNLVQALVKDLFTPLLGLLGGRTNFSNLSFAFRGSQFQIGDFLNAVISFLINALVIYFFVVLPMQKLLKVARRPGDPVTKHCPDCQSKVPIKAQRCAFCTSWLDGRKQSDAARA